jgi:hypothetical protein
MLHEASRLIKLGEGSKVKLYVLLFTVLGRSLLHTPAFLTSVKSSRYPPDKSREEICTMKMKIIFCPLRQPKPIFWLASTLITLLTYSKLFANCIHISLHDLKLAYENLYKYGTVNSPQRKKYRRRVLLQRVFSARTVASSWEAFVSTLQRVL